VAGALGIRAVYYLGGVLLLVAGMVGLAGLSTGIAQHGDSRLTAPVGREVPAETSHARCCARVLRWLVGARRACPTGLNG
jgi:hypothetical protein